MEKIESIGCNYFPSEKVAGNQDGLKAAPRTNRRDWLWSCASDRSRRPAPEKKQKKTSSSRATKAGLTEASSSRCCFKGGARHFSERVKASANTHRQRVGARKWKEGGGKVHRRLPEGHNFKASSTDANLLSGDVRSCLSIDEDLHPPAGDRQKAGCLDESRRARGHTTITH